MTCGDPGVCDKVTGHCNGSYPPGWEGDMCQNSNNLYKIMFITLGYPSVAIYALCFFLHLE